MQNPLIHANIKNNDIFDKGVVLRAVAQLLGVKIISASGQNLWIGHFEPDFWHSQLNSTGLSDQKYDFFEKNTPKNRAFLFSTLKKLTKNEF